MSDTKTTSWIAALERARAELERSLSADEHWRGLREGGAQSSRPDYAPGHERALAGNPVFRCWEHLNEAIEELRKAQAGPTTARRRVSLREVLERIRSDVELQEAPAQPTVSEVARTKPTGMEPPGAAPPSASMEGGLGIPSARPTVDMAPEPEEATVSFVIRKPARAAPVAEHGSEASAPKEPPPPAAPELEPEPDAEAEVTIVPRRR